MADDQKQAETQPQQQQEAPAAEVSEPPTEPAKPASEPQPAAEPVAAAEAAKAEPETPKADPATEGAAAKEPPLQAALDEFTKMGKTAFVAGFTGECGKMLVEELARTKIFSKVTLIGRREVSLEGDVYKDFAVEQKVVDFDNLEASVDVFKGPSVGYCCIGTTRGKAGKEGFRKVDHDYVMKVAELAKQNGCEQYHLVSSTGANAKSSMLYTKVKGQVEEETAELGFDKFVVYRPGLLMCPRKEFRLGEAFARVLFKPVDYLSPGTMTNTTLSVAQAMIARTVKPPEEKKEILDGKAIFRASKDITG